MSNESIRARWEELHAGLLRSIDERESVRSFEALRSQKPALAPFEEPAAVAAFLVRKENGLAERDRVLRCLVAEATVGTAKQIALALLILGLWPGLDAIFRKRRRLFRAQAHDIELEIIDQFVAQVQRINLGRVSCLAATLVLNTEREVVDARIRECVRAAKSDPVTPDVISAPPIEDEPPPASRFALPSGQSDAEDVAALRRWLQSAVGQDADLVVNAVIHQRSRLALATALGISHAAARQRLARALGRAREAFLVQEQGR
jgi:RNA polymerase sigma-70 factor (ECF subfamily)